MVGAVVRLRTRRMPTALDDLNESPDEQVHEGHPLVVPLVRTGVFGYPASLMTTMTDL